MSPHAIACSRLLRKCIHGMSGHTHKRGPNTLSLAVRVSCRRNKGGGHWMGSGEKQPNWARAATAPSTTFRSTLSAEVYPTKPFQSLRTPAGFGNNTL